MLLKCVGGPNDDEYHEVDLNRYKINDAIQIHQRPVMLAVMDMPNIDDIPKATAMKVEYYRVYCFRNINETRSNVYDKILFLIHQPMTIIQAMEHQFKKNAMLTDRARKTIKQLIEEHGFEYSLKVTIQDKQELAKCLKLEDGLEHVLGD